MRSLGIIFSSLAVADARKLRSLSGHHTFTNTSRTHLLRSGRSTYIFLTISLVLPPRRSPASASMSDWDTAPITLRKRIPKASAMKSEQAVNAARRQGVAVETQAKWGGGANRQHVTTKNTAKLDRETEELKHETVSLDLGKLIQQGRQSKGLSQKDLATKVNEKTQVINDYEAGRGIPNQMVIGKIERVLGIKLRGKDRGMPLPAPTPKK